MDARDSRDFRDSRQRWLARKYATLWWLRTCERRKLYREFDLTDYATWVRVVDVYDGDTLKVLMSYRGRVDMWRVRMDGYDAPEMKPLKTHPRREEEMERAKRSRNALRDMTMGCNLFMRVRGFDKYGRLLGDLYNRRIHINKFMIENGYGYKYSGGKKLNS